MIATGANDPYYRKTAASLGRIILIRRKQEADNSVPWGHDHIVFKDGFHSVRSEVPNGYREVRPIDGSAWQVEDEPTLVNDITYALVQFHLGAERAPEYL